MGPWDLARAVLREWAVIDWDMRSLPLTELVVDSVKIQIDGIVAG